MPHRISSDWRGLRRLNMSLQPSRCGPCASVRSWSSVAFASEGLTVLQRTASASSSRPRRTSQRGDSGMPRRPKAITTGGRQPRPSM